MTTVDRKIAPPERLAGQGLDPNQEESGNRAIVALLTDDSHGETDWVATYRSQTRRRRRAPRRRLRGLVAREGWCASGASSLRAAATATR